MTTDNGKPIMIATIHEWVVAMQQRDFKSIPQLPGLVHIDQYKEGAAFEKELV